MAKNNNLFFLIGFMGTGKSYWGKIWATINNFNFIDMDEAIEASTGMPITTIFEANGEDYFRKLETEMLHSFASLQNTIIACGGGAACFNNNIDWMNKQGTTIYIKSTPNEIIKRVALEPNKRPLLIKKTPEELLQYIEQKLAERNLFYNKANYTIDAETATDKSISFLIPSNNK